jgi:hypothetical protein
MPMPLFYTAIAFFCILGINYSDTPDGIQFVFKSRTISLRYGMQGGKAVYFPRAQPNNARLDTLSNWYNPASNYVEIIRQDDPFDPGMGLAMGFEFDEEIEEYPFTPAHAVLQLKNFHWGGIEFSSRDTMNFTGVNNHVSSDLMIEVDGYRNDTIWGRFSGLLVSGAGPMASIEEGRFRVRVYRVK